MKKLSTWLIIIGILVAAIPLGGRLYMQMQQEKMYKDYLAQMKTQPTADILDEDFADEISTSEAIKAQAIKPKVIENVIGRIKIPSISANLLLLEGSSTKEMRFGAGHVIGSAMPGADGNCAISAHRNYTFGSYFSRLGEIKQGDLIRVSYNNNTFVYSVTDISVVLPSDVSVLKSTKLPTITLITCHPKGSNTHRLIVKGVLLVDGKPVTADPAAVPPVTTPPAAVPAEPSTAPAAAPTAPSASPAAPTAPAAAPAAPTAPTPAAIPEPLVTTQSGIDSPQ